MSKNAKVLVGIFTFLPVLLFILFFINFFNTVLNLVPGFDTDRINQMSGRQVLEMFGPMFMYIILLSLNCLGLLIYYIIHAVNNTNLDSNERILWVLLFVFIGLIAFPIYFFVKIVKSPPASAVV